jgi:hypothetical protein
VSDSANYEASLFGQGTATSVTSVNTLTGAVTLFVANAQTSTYQVLAADFSACKTITVAAGTFTITLVASGSQPPSGQCIDVINYGSGVVTIARSGQNINGGTASLTLPAASATAPTWSHVVSDGANYEASLVTTAIPLSTGSTFTYVTPIELVLGACQNATSTISVSTPASNPPSPGCSGGPNTTFGFAQFSATTQTLQARITLPGDWASGAGNDVTFIFADVTDNNAAHNEVFNFQTVKVSNGATQDPSFSAAQLATVAVQGTVLQRNSSTITTFTCTSCAAGDTLFLKFGLDSSRTATGNANLQSIIVKLKRTVTTL